MVDQRSGGGVVGVRHVLLDGRRLDLEQALARLNPVLRETVLLVCVEEMSYGETAEVLGVPVGTVMSRLSRGREQLRQLTSGEPAIAPAPRLKIVS